MANQVVINQGDYVYFYDLSIGSVISRDWLFPGGTPTGGTGFAQAVQYTGVNSAGYSVGLTIFDASTSKSITEPNIVSVSPQDFFVSLQITDGTNPISSTDMSRNVVFTATGPTGSGISQYTWSIPGTAGFTGTSNTYSISLIDWSNLTGSNLGAVYTPYVTTPTVIATTVLGQSANAYQTLTYNKSGYEEELNLCDYPGSTGSHYTLYISSSPVEDPSNTSGFSIGATSYYLTSAFGFTGNGLFVQIEESTPVFNNAYFHAQGEAMTLLSPSWDVGSGSVLGQVVASYSAYNSMGLSPAAAVSSLPRYTVGNYMYPGDISGVQGDYFYFADTSNVLKTLGVATSDPPVSSSRYWSAESIGDYLNDISFGSISSRSFEKNVTASSSTWLPGYRDIAGAIAEFPNSLNRGGPCIPFDVDTAPLNWTVSFYTSNTRSLDDLTLRGPYDIELYGVLDTGNSPSGKIFVAGDNVHGQGIASRIEDWISSNNLSPYIGVTADQKYCTFERAYEILGDEYPDPAEFNGLSIFIKEDYISNSYPYPIGITGNTFLLKMVFSGNVQNTHISPNTNYSIASWLGFSQDYISNPYQEQNDPDQPKRGWQFNG